MEVRRSHVTARRPCRPCSLCSASKRHVARCGFYPADNCLTTAKTTFGDQHAPGTRLRRSGGTATFPSHQRGIACIDSHADAASPASVCGRWWWTEATFRPCPASSRQHEAFSLHIEIATTSPVRCWIQRFLRWCGITPTDHRAMAFAFTRAPAHARPGENSGWFLCRWQQRPTLKVVTGAARSDREDGSGFVVLLVPADRRRRM